MPENIQNKTDNEIVELTLQDVDFFSELISRYENPLIGFIMKISHASIEDAEDILQEVFLKVYRNLYDFDPDMKFSSWIYRITRNHVISEFRKNQNRPHNHSVPIDEVHIKTLASDLRPDKNIDIAFLRKNIYKILDQLDNKYREVIILRFFEQKDYNEISDIIKNPAGTVATLLNRAKKYFIKELEKQKIELK